MQIAESSPIALGSVRQVLPGGKPCLGIKLAPDLRLEPRADLSHHASQVNGRTMPNNGRASVSDPGNCQHRIQPVR